MALNKRQLKEKIFFILDFALNENEFHKDNPYIVDYIKIIFRIAKKINYRLPSEFHYKVCKNCYCIRNFTNTTIRIENFKKSNKINKFVKLHCKNCDYIKKINFSKHNLKK
jgi:RNase P subunit RPR2